MEERGNQEPSGAADWLLSAEERGNPDSDIDRRRDDGRGWTEGNQVEALVDGAAYFARLYEVLTSLDDDAFVHLCDWRRDGDERLTGPGSELGTVLADVARRGVSVRGLIWPPTPTRRT